MLGLIEKEYGIFGNNPESDLNILQQLFWLKNALYFVI